VAISSYPFDNQDSTEGQYTTLFRELQLSGVADTFGGSGWQITATTGMNVSVQSGFAIVRGHGVQNTAPITLSIPAATSAPIIHMVVLRLDPSANTITPVVISGVANGPAPTPSQTDTGIYEMPLATILVPPGTINVDPTKVTDLRPFVGQQPSAWSTTTRPATPRLSRLGYNASTSEWEFWNGSAWATVTPASVTSRITVLENQQYIMRTEPQRVGVVSKNILHNTWTDLDWRTANGGQSGITYTFADGTFAFPTAGVYEYKINVTLDANATGTRSLRLTRGASTPVDLDSRDGTALSYTTLRVSGEVRLNAGDILTTACLQTSGGALAMIDSVGYQKVSFRRVGS
jgi:hypothetical protein